MNFKEWFIEDEHDLYNYPEEAMEAAFNAGVKQATSGEPRKKGKKGKLLKDWER